MKTRMQEQFQGTVMASMTESFGYANPLQVPRLEKIVLNMGIGEGVQDAKKVQAAARELALIAGQRPVITRAKRSIAAYKLREGMPIGCRVTLRGRRMYEFLDRLVNIALPRVRDFRGVSPKAFDGRGNYTLGVKDQLVFQEINYNRVQQVKGMNVCIVTTAQTDEEGRALLDGLGMPFRKTAAEDGS